MPTVDFSQKPLQRLRRGKARLHKRLVQSIQHRRPEMTVLVAGAPRSGTNMLMDVFDRSMATDVYHEYDSRAFLDYRLRPEGDIQLLRQNCRATHFVLKPLLDAHALPRLMRALAPAKAIWLLRGYDDVVNSMRASFQAQTRLLRNVAADLTSDAWLAEGLSPARQALLREEVDEDLDDTSAAGLIWYLRNVIFFERRLHLDPRILLVRYESLVTAPYETLRHVFHFIGLDYHRRLCRNVHARSIRKQPAPPIRASVRTRCSALFERFQEETPTLSPLHYTITGTKNRTCRASRTWSSNG